DPAIDSYSGCFDNGRRKSTGMGEWLKARGAIDAYVLGLATDYCVRATALDLASLGFRTQLVLDGCRGVDLSPGDSERAVSEMKRAGVVVTSSTEVLTKLSPVTGPIV